MHAWLNLHKMKTAIKRSYLLTVTIPCYNHLNDNNKENKTRFNKETYKYILKSPINKITFTINV